MGEDFFILKVACLLHDPPTKAWDLVKRRNHEEAAKDIAHRILSGTVLEEAKGHLGDDCVKRADRLAAGVDRWLLGHLVGDDYGKLPCDEIKIKNIFNPIFSDNIKDEPNEGQVNEFCNRMRAILTSISDIRLAYHALYACYEPYWILGDLPSGPADTRAPSHNVFDHNYATASMMNWLIGGNEPKGILLYIDLGGPQRFISRSRKLMDLWISSYLASALAWRLFWTFIRVLGPDIMVLPSCRGNPFYYHSLISELMWRAGEAAKPMKELVKEIIDYDPDSDVIPKYATVPVTATLMLPDLNILKEFDEFRSIDSLDSLKKFVEEEYGTIWREVYDEVIKNCERLDGKFGKLATEAAALLRRCKDYGFESPPMPIRVVTISIDDLYKMGSFKDENGWQYLYHYIFKLLEFHESKNKIYKLRPEENLKLYDLSIDFVSGSMTSYYEGSKRGFDYCSVCGHLPAIIAIPSEDGLKKIESNIKIEPAFSPGERLCPYCLLKRLLSESEVLNPVMDKLLGRASQKKIMREFRSVSDIAVIPFKASFIEAAERIDRAIDIEPKERFSRLMSDVLKGVFQEIMEAEIAEGGHAHGVVKATGIMYMEEPTFDKERKLFKIIENIKHDSIREHAKVLLFLNSEKAILGSPELRRIWGKLLSDLRGGKGYERVRYYMDPEKISNICTYYAVIRSDADNFGKIIKGEVEDGFRIKIKDYLQNLLEGNAKKIVQAIIEKRFEDARKLCEENGIKDPDDRINRLNELIEDLICKKGIIISQSYHSALSKSLMDNSFRDAQLMGKYGLAIYAGGDDLLAILPVKDCLRAVKELRTNFSFPLREPRGFYKKRRYLLPSLATASRSFSVYLCHYMFPMYVIMNRSAKLLDELAKEAEWIFCKTRKRKKDSLAFSYSPRGGERSAVLPLKDARLPDEDLASDIETLQRLMDLIEAPTGPVSFSNSVIYDLYNELEFMEELAERGDEFLLGNILENILYRNCEVENGGRNRDKIREEVKRWASELLNNYDLSVKINEERITFLRNFVLGLMIYRSGLREVV